MKILLIGDYSNYNYTLGTALAAMGHDVTLASDGCRWMHVGRDIDLSRKLPGKAGGALLWLKLRYVLPSRLSGFDVVQINNPLFVDLRPQRVAEIFGMLKRRNGAVFLTAMGTDSFYVDMCTASDSPLRYNEWRVNDRPSPMAECQTEELSRWLSPIMMDHCRRIYDGVDGAVSVLYEYHLALQRYMPDRPVAYGGIPIDVENVSPTVNMTEVPVCVNLFLGRHATRQLEKGTDRLGAVAAEVARRYPDRCRFMLVEDRPYAEYIELLNSGHVLLDQLYSYTPATNALLGMARGMTAVSGAEGEYYEFIGERDLRPIVNAEPDNADGLLLQIESLVLNPELIPTRAAQGRAFVLKHNDSRVVASRYLDFWQSVMSK